MSSIPSTTNHKLLKYLLLCVSLILLLVKQIKSSENSITNALILASLLIAWIVQASKLDYFVKFVITLVLAICILTHASLVYLEKLPKKEVRHAKPNIKKRKNLTTQFILEIFIGLLLITVSFMSIFKNGYSHVYSTSTPHTQYSALNKT